MVSVSGFRSLGILLRLPNIYVAQTSPSSSSLISCRRSLSCSCASWKTYNSIADTDQVIHLSVNNFKKTPMTFEELKELAASEKSEHGKKLVKVTLPATREPVFKIMTNKEFEISVRSSRYKASGMRHEIWDLSEGGGDGTDAPVTQTKTKEKKLELRSSIMDRDFDIKMRQVSKWIGKNYFVTVRLIDFTGRGESEAMEKRIKDCLAQSLGPEVTEERLYLLSFKGSGKKATS